MHDVLTVFFNSLMGPPEPLDTKSELHVSEMPILCQPKTSGNVKSQSNFTFLIITNIYKISIKQCSELNVKQILIQYMLL